MYHSVVLKYESAYKQDVRFYREVHINVDNQRSKHLYMLKAFVWLFF